MGRYKGKFNKLKKSDLLTGKPYSMKDVSRPIMIPIYVIMYFLRIA